MKRLRVWIVTPYRLTIGYVLKKDWNDKTKTIVKAKVGPTQLNVIRGGFNSECQNAAFRKKSSALRFKKVK